MFQLRSKAHSVQVTQDQEAEEAKPTAPANPDEITIDDDEDF